MANVNIKKEGNLDKQSKFVKVWKKRWTVLQHHPEDNKHYLYTYESEKECENPTEAIAIDEGTEIKAIQDKDADKNMFYVQNKKKKEIFHFRAHSRLNRNEWIEAINNARKAQQITEVNPTDENYKVDDSKHDPNIKSDQNEACPVRQVLDKYNLVEYYQKFIDEGYDQVDDLADLDMDILENDIEMKKGHARRFLKKLHASHNDVEENKEIDPLDDYYKQYPERRNWSGIKYAPSAEPCDPSCVSGTGRKNKVIMVIGETGTGKTTLLDSMTNYLFDVKFNDKFRFKLINEDKQKLEREEDVESMTDDVTAYYLRPTNPNIKFDLTVVDTPGFGDTRGLDKDRGVVDKIEQFFKTEINTITGICLAIKASNTRLTAAQKYIFSTLLGLFGKDIADNIFVLVTFCDAKKPPCIRALKATKTPYKMLFKFNNSAFFLDEDSKDGDYEEDDADFNQNLWNIGMRSFQKFFEEIGRTEDKGLDMTELVLETRGRLLVSIENLHGKIKEGTTKIVELENTKNQLEQMKDIMNANKEFRIKVTVMEEYKKPLAKGTHTTVCMNCNYTCHRECKLKNDDDKYKCWAMNKETGYCKICNGKCHWKDHANRPYTWERKPVVKVKTDKTIKNKYGLAKDGMTQGQHVLNEMQKEIFNVKVDVLNLIKEVSKANDSLKVYALRHNPVDQKQYIELMIRSEKNDLKMGWQKRIESLENLKGMLTTLQSIDTKNYDEALKKIMIFSGASVTIRKEQKKNFAQKAWSAIMSWK